MASEPKKQAKKTHSWLKASVLFIFQVISVWILMFMMVLLAGGYTGYAFIKDAPTLNPEMLKMPQSSVLYDRNGKELMILSGIEYREVTAIKDIPYLVQNAFIAVEDQRFYEHKGVDIERVGGAIVANLEKGFGAEGASTITQQVIKNTYLTPEKTLKRKVQEAYLAYKFEKSYSKEEILGIYLNKIYFGNGAYGVTAAAKTYFGKTLDQLTVAEAALLAGLPQRPASYDPYDYPEKAESRRNTVLSQMRKAGFISEPEYVDALHSKVVLLPHASLNDLKHRSFIDQVIEELKQLGFTEQEIYNGGLHIQTTLDQQLQAHMEEVLTTNEYIPFPNEKLQAGAVLLDSKTGEVLAVGGGRKKEPIRRGFNYATQIERQPGSTIKPILDYGPGIEYLNWPTTKTFDDKPLAFDGKQVANWDRSYRGSIPMRKALQWSYNIPAMNAYLEVGAERAKQFAGNLGIQLDTMYPAYAIGGFTTGISPLELAGAYSAFANNGIFNAPHTIRKVSIQGEIEQSGASDPVQAMSEETAYMITDLLKTVVQKGTGKMANIEGLPLAGKTGTTNLPDHLKRKGYHGTSDAWFAGYTTNYTIAVWTGYDETTAQYHLKKGSDHLAKLIFKEMMSYASKGKETADFQKPPGLEVINNGSQTEFRKK